ncbi:MAG: BatD family protein [Bacteroidales bacterium]|nr:BatD family protein [Bacteroidales bacterium]
MKHSMLIWILFLVLAGPKATANDISLTVSAPAEVAAGERFHMVFSVNARPDQFTPPSMGDFRIVSGPSQSSSSSTQIVNRQVTTTHTVSYTYILEAHEEGEFVIDGATVVVGGESYKAGPHHIRVTQRRASPPPSSDPRAAPQTPEHMEIPGPEDIFIRAKVDNKTPFRGEQIIVTYLLYTRLDITSYTIDGLPSYQGFWSETLSGRQTQVTSEIVNGVSYRVAEIRRVALFPQHSGELRINPLAVDMGVRVRRPQPQRRGSIFDEFFGGSRFDSFQTVQHRVHSNALTVEVQPLPAQNRPPEFNGAVGSYELQAWLRPDELDINDASNFIISISGTGNIRMLEPPNIQFPRHLEVFDPRIEEDIEVSLSGISGSRLFDYLVIPRSAGPAEIPAVRFSYFDPKKGQYVMQTAGPFILNVSGEADLYTRDRSLRADSRMFAEDIRFIKLHTGNWRVTETLFFKSTGFYILITSPFVLLLIFLMMYRKRLKEHRNTAMLRTKKARKVARKRLKQAYRFMQEGRQKEFYDEIFRTLWGYISDKLNIPPAQLNKEQVAAIFREKKVAAALAEKFLKSLEECEFARFAPSSLENPMQETYQTAMDTIITLEKELRKQSADRL